MRIFSATMLAGLIAIAGCYKESERGGPGAPATDGRSATDRRTTDGRSPTDDRAIDKRTTNGRTARDDENTFTIKVPPTATDVDQGGRKEVTVQVNRGSAFNQAVRLRFKAPQGLKVTPADTNVPSGQKEVKVTIEAETDAPTGKTSIEVTATPETGKEVSINMPVEVNKET
jgi:hypothetical protein